MNARATVRRCMRATLSLGIVGAVVGLAAVPASAATSFTVTSGGSDARDKTYTSLVTFNVSGHVDASLTSGQTLRLLVERPGVSDPFVLAKKDVTIGNGGTISASLDTTCAPWASSCTPVENGDYVFKFTSASNGNVSVKGNPLTVTLAVRPAKPDAPTGFNAVASGTVAGFSWNTVSDADGYRLYDGATALADVEPSVCDSTCAVSYNYGPAAYGSTHTFHAVALRDGASGTVESDASNSKSVTFPDAPSDPADGGGTSGGGSGSGSGSGGTSGGGTSGGSTGGSGGGHGGRATTGDVVHDLDSKLPTLTAGAAPNLPSVLTTVKPLPQGDYEPVLPYDDQYVGETERTEVPGKASAIVSDVTQVLDSGALWRGLAGAAVLMLVVAHLRAWVEHVEVD